MNSNQRKSAYFKRLAEESIFHKMNPTHSGVQVIPTACRPLPNGKAKLDRKDKGHTWSKFSRTLTNKKGITKKIIQYENWGTKFGDQMKLNPSNIEKL